MYKKLIVRVIIALMMGISGSTWASSPDESTPNLGSTETSNAENSAQVEEYDDHSLLPSELKDLEITQFQCHILNEPEKIEECQTLQEHISTLTIKCQEECPSRIYAFIYETSLAFLYLPAYAWGALLDFTSTIAVGYPNLLNKIVHFSFSSEHCETCSDEPPNMELPSLTAQVNQRFIEALNQKQEDSINEACRQTLDELDKVLVEFAKLRGL